MKHGIARLDGRVVIELSKAASKKNRKILFWKVLEHGVALKTVQTIFNGRIVPVSAKFPSAPCGRRNHRRVPNPRDRAG